MKALPYFILHSMLLGFECLRRSVSCNVNPCLRSCPSFARGGFPAEGKLYHPVKLMLVRLPQEDDLELAGLCG